jgi:hypothetical protein
MYLKGQMIRDVLREVTVEGRRVEARLITVVVFDRRGHCWADDVIRQLHLRFANAAGKREPRPKMT